MSDRRMCDAPGCRRGGTVFVVYRGRDGEALYTAPVCEEHWPLLAEAAQRAGLPVDDRRHESHGSADV